MAMSSISRRTFPKATATSAGAAALLGGCDAWRREAVMARAAANTASFDLLAAEKERRRGDLPTAAFFHRLPLPWYLEEVRMIKAEASR